MGALEDEDTNLGEAPLVTSDSTHAQFFDLQPPASQLSNVRIEDLAKRLFADEHLLFILQDHVLFQKFSAFINRFKPQLVPTLVRYLEMRKAIKAIEYANAVARKIQWPSHADFRGFPAVQATSIDVRFEDYTRKELSLLVKEALPAWITYNLTNIVVDCVAKDITGHGVPALQDLVGNLAEVFCLTDPSVEDNPIIYASEEFHRTTQYGTSYAIDRNCRFLQGPGTDRDAVRRVAQAIARGREINEVLLNYRRDGTPFMNLCMVSPLYDDKGTIRYFIGAQIDISGLIEDGRGIESFNALLRRDHEHPFTNGEHQKDGEKLRLSQSGDPNTKRSVLHDRTQDMLGKLQELSNMFSRDEADIVTKNCRATSSEQFSDAGSIRSVVPNSRGPPKRVIESEDMSSFGHGLSQLNMGANGGQGASLPGVYKHYLLVRPYPNLQIIFVSPSLRLPGLLRTPLFHKLGGPQNTLAALEEAFKDGAAVTAKVLWLPKNNGQSNNSLGMGAGMGREVRSRWIRCTPLLGNDDRVGVWMVILVPVDGERDLGSNGYSTGLGPPFGPLPIPSALSRDSDWKDSHGYNDMTDGETDHVKKYNRVASVHGLRGIITPQNSGRSSRASSITRTSEKTNTGLANKDPAGEGRNDAASNYKLRKVTSTTHLPSHVHAAKEHTGRSYAGSVARGRGRTTPEGFGPDNETYADYLRSSSSTRWGGSPRR